MELLKDLNSGRTSQEIFESWTENSEISSTSDGFKYFVSELSVAFNLDLTGFSENFPLVEVVTWEIVKKTLIKYLESNEDRGSEKSIEKVLKKGSQGKLAQKTTSEKVFKRKTDSWISPFIDEYQEDVIGLLVSLDEEQSGWIKGNQLQNLLTQMLKLFKVTMEEKDLFLFTRMVENRYKKSTNEKTQRYKYLKLSYNQCIGLIEEWALKESFKEIRLNSKIQDTIAEYESILKVLKQIPDLSEILQTFLKETKKIRTKTSTKTMREISDLQVKGSKEIFAFYASQIKMVGQHPTFTELKEHKAVLNLSKFTKFCSDFDVINTSKDKQKVPLKQVSNVFIKATSGKRVMDYGMFMNSLSYIADSYYSEKYDQLYHENLSNLPIEEKKKRLLLLLQFENPEVYNKKLKGFGRAFSLEKAGYRIPEYDLSKQYKFRDQGKVKQKIEMWKQQKKEGEHPIRSKSVPTQARIRAIQQSLLNRPDRVTWDLLNKNSHFISKEDLSMILAAEDINELLRNGAKICK